MTTRATDPPMRVSSEASDEQLHMARGQGEAYGKALRAAGATATCRAGDYLVAFVNDEAEGAYEWDDGELVWREAAPDANVHLEVAIADGADGRFVPGLAIHVDLAQDGNSVLSTDLPFLWHPYLYHYGGNAALPGTGPYDVTVRVAPPRFMRHDPVNGQRYMQPVEATFTGVQLANGRKASPQAQPRGADAPTAGGAGGLPEDWSAAAARARTADDVRARAPHDPSGVPSSGR